MTRIPPLRIALPPDPTRSSGSTLLILLAVLLVLALLASVLLVLFPQGREPQSVGQLNVVRARMLAESGVEQALARLADWALENAHDPWAAPWIAAEFQDKNRNGLYDPDVDALTAYDPRLPLDGHLWPSFRGAALARLGERAEAVIRPSRDSGRKVRIGLTGTWRPLLPERLDCFSVKVLDCASMLYVNGPRAGPATWALAPNAIRTLDHLGACESVGIPSLGRRLSEWRSTHARDFVDADEVERALAATGVGPDRVRRIRDLVTCHAWVDDRTLLPGALGPSPLDAGDPLGAPTLRWGARRPRPRGRALLPLPPVWALPAPAAWTRPVDPLFGAALGVEPAEPPESGERGDPAFGSAPLLQPRAPVNVNTAPVEVLFAVLCDLSGYWIDPAPRLEHGLTTGPGRRECGGRARIDPPTALALAKALAEARTARPFRCWQQFDDFIDALPAALLAPVQKRLVKANANPNSRLSKFNPDRTLGVRFADLDKADLGDWCRGPWDADRNQPLCGWTTEFCFSSMGCYQVESIGRTCGAIEADGARPVLEETRITAVARIYEVLRHTTQKDFEKFSVSRSTTPSGAATVITYPESMADLRLHAWSGESGLEAQCLSRAEAPPSGPPCNHALCYDGHVGLAPRDLALPPGLTFRADFTSGFDAEFALESRSARGNADAHRLLIDQNDPSELFPDGVFCHETRRRGYRYDAETYGREQEPVEEYLRYGGGANFPPAGSLSLWVKPTWDGRDLFVGRRPRDCALDARVFFSAGPACAPETWQGAADRLVLFAREGAVGLLRGDCRERTEHDRRPEPFTWESPLGFLGVPLAGPRADARSWRAGEWHHLACAWRPGQAWLYVDGEPAAGNPLRFDGAPRAGGFASEWSLFLGSNRFGEAACNGFPLDADATIDSLRISQRPVLEGRVQDRYPGGDQFLGFTGIFPAGPDFPALLRKGRLGTVAWTWWRPERGGGIEVGVNVGAAPEETGFARAEGAYGGEGASLRGRAEVAAGSTLYYTVRFLPAAPNARGFIDESPLLDDLTITFVQTPRILLWNSVSRRGE